MTEHSHPSGFHRPQQHGELVEFLLGIIIEQNDIMLDGIKSLHAPPGPDDTAALNALTDRVDAMQTKTKAALETVPPVSPT